MSDIYIPGVRSRFDSERIIEGLMAVERIPRDRAERQVETLQEEKGYWQEIGTRISSLRESARNLFSFQNPFSERTAFSSDPSILTATATRQAVEQERSFVVRQVARADRFLSDTLDPSFRVEAGNYTFKIGNDEINLNYRGGSIQDFIEVLNRRGSGKIQASIINIERGRPSLLVESLITGAENRLTFSGAAEDLARRIGLGQGTTAPEQNPALPDRIAVTEDALTVLSGNTSSISFSPDAQELSSQRGIILSFETSTAVTPTPAQVVEAAPSGPDIPGSGSVSYGGITIENQPSAIPLPDLAVSAPPPPVRVDDMAFLSLRFSDGSSAALPLIQDSTGFIPARINLDEIAGSRAIASIEIVNNNTNRDLSIRNINLFNPAPQPEFRAANALSTAQDAIIAMDGIEIRRPSNEIDDLIPGVTIIARTASDTSITLNIEPDREAIKDAIINLVGNYNRLMGELNVLTRNDERVLQELTYLTTEERSEMRQRLGIFSGDSMLNQLRSRMQQAVTTAYLTDAENELSMLAHIGVGTDLRRAGAIAGYDPSRLRGYLEIDEKMLDAALLKDLRPIQQLFGNDTTGDLIADSGVAVVLDSISRPFVETGGVIALRTGTIDTRISQEERRIETLDRQLAAREATLQRQYGNMENAYNRMEQMGNSLDNFNQQMLNNNRR